MKKLVVLALLLVMVFSLTGCGEEVVITRGVIDGTVYTSETIGISFEAPEDWKYYSDEEIAQVQSLSGEAFDIENIDSEELLYDMMCVNASTGESINIVYENLNLLYGSILDEESYLELAKTNMEKALGEIATSMEISTIEIDGNAFPCIKMVGDYGVVTMEQVVAVEKVGTHMALITISAFSEEGVSDIIDMMTVK